MPLATLKLTLFECPLYGHEPTCRVRMTSERMILCDGRDWDRTEPNGNPVRSAGQTDPQEIDR